MGDKKSRQTGNRGMSPIIRRILYARQILYDIKSIWIYNALRLLAVDIANEFSEQENGI